MAMDTGPTSVVQLDAVKTDGEDAQTAPLFSVKHEDDVSLKYAAIPNLPEKIKRELAKHDADNNGEISMAELLNLTQSNTRLSHTVCYLAVGMLLLLGALFGVSWAVAKLAQDTGIQDQSMTVKGSDGIVKTALSTTEIPLAYAALLDQQTLARVNRLVFNKLKRGSAILSSGTYIMNVDSMLQTNQSFIQFYGRQGQDATVNKGIITVKGIPFYPGETLDACAKASCSSITVAGQDLTKLKATASMLGYKSISRRTWTYWCDIDPIVTPTANTAM